MWSKRLRTVYYVRSVGTKIDAVEESDVVDGPVEYLDTTVVCMPQYSHKIDDLMNRLSLAEAVVELIPLTIHVTSKYSDFVVAPVDR